MAKDFLRLKRPSLFDQASKTPRQHAWHAPFEPQQVLPWISLCSSYGCVFGFLLPPKSNGWEGFVASYVSCTVLMLVCGVATTYLVSPQGVMDVNRPGETSCDQCGIRRSPFTKTHHCSKCNRCCDHFDHHCPWINSCVSDRNLPWFYGLCWFSVFIFSIHFAFLGYVQSNGGPFDNGTKAGIAILSILPFIALVSLLGLLIHLFYIRAILGLTTLEYLKRNGERRGQKMLDKEAQRLESRREEIERQQERVREEWRKNREKEMAEKRARESKQGSLPVLMTKLSSTSSYVSSPATASRMSSGRPIPTPVSVTASPRTTGHESAISPTSTNATSSTHFEDAIMEETNNSLTIV